MGKHDLDMSTTWLEPHIPMLAEKLGADVPLKLTMHMKDMKVLFGQYDTDIIIEYTACMSMKMDLIGSREFIYDELRMISSMDMKMSDDFMFIHLLNHKHDIDT